MVLRGEFAVPYTLMKYERNRRPNHIIYIYIHTPLFPAFLLTTSKQRKLRVQGLPLGLLISDSGLGEVVTAQEKRGWIWG